MDGWMDGWMDGRRYVDKMMDEWIVNRQKINLNIEDG